MPPMMPGQASPLQSLGGGAPPPGAGPMGPGPQAGPPGPGRGSPIGQQVQLQFQPKPPGIRMSVRAPEGSLDVDLDLESAVAALMSLAEAVAQVGGVDLNQIMGEGGGMPAPGGMGGQPPGMGAMGPPGLGGP